MPQDLDNLEAKITQFKAGKNAEIRKKTAGDADNDNMNNGIRAGAEMVVTIGAGTLIGYGLDSWLSTKPLFLIIFLLAGVCAGFFNIYKITQNIGATVTPDSLQKAEKDVRKTPEIEDE